MWALVAAGSIFFPGLFIVSKQTLKQMLGWTEGDAAIVSTRLFVELSVSVWCRRFRPSWLRRWAGIIVSSCTDVMEDKHWLTDAYILFATPYFIYDIYAMFLCYWHKLQVKGHEEDSARPVGGAVVSYLRRELLLVLHHVFMVAACCPASLLWRRGKGDFFQGVLFLAELSTPFVCLGKVLIQFKRQQTIVHKVNGAFVLLTFFICRVLLFPYLYYSYSKYSSMPVYAVLLVAPWQCNMGAAFLWSLQLYWFILICRRALRLFTGHSLPSLKDVHDDSVLLANGCRGLHQVQR